MSKKFNTVKGFFEKGFWTAKMVKRAVVYGWITEEEFTEITGEPYVKTE